MISKKRAIEIKQYLTDTIKSKLLKYNPETAHMPFHWAILGKDRMGMFSFIQSINTSMGMSIFEQVGKIIAKDNFEIVDNQVIPPELGSSNSLDEVKEILISLETTNEMPNEVQEYQKLLNSITSSVQKRKLTRIDLYLEKDDEVYLIDVKTVKANKGEVKGIKTTLLEWKSVYLFTNSSKRYHSLLGLPYNPYYPEPYNRFTFKGMLDLEKEMLVAEEFWDFLGGSGTYDQLIEIFQEVGNEQRDSIDSFFKNLNEKSNNSR